jgi:hypothetical protein
MIRFWHWLKGKWTYSLEYKGDAEEMIGRWKRAQSELHRDLARTWRDLYDRGQGKP